MLLRASLQGRVRCLNLPPRPVLAGSPSSAPDLADGEPESSDSTDACRRRPGRRGVAIDIRRRDARVTVLMGRHLPSALAPGEHSIRALRPRHLARAKPVGRRNVPHARNTDCHHPVHTDRLARSWRGGWSRTIASRPRMGHGRGSLAIRRRQRPRKHRSLLRPAPAHSFPPSHFQRAVARFGGSARHSRQPPRLGHFRSASRSRRLPAERASI